MERTSKELLQLEHKDLSSSFNESALLVCGKKEKSPEKRSNSEAKLSTAALPRSQVIGKVRDFLGVISEANKTLELNAKENPEAFDIEVLHGTGAKYIEMDLMLGVADLNTQEAMDAAEAAVSGNQRVDLHPNNDSSSESESSSDDDVDDSDDVDDDEQAVSSKKQPEKMQVDGSLPQQSESRAKRKRPKIIELP